jgi:hypothetical protein
VVHTATVLETLQISLKKKKESRWSPTKRHSCRVSWTLANSFKGYLGQGSHRAQQLVLHTEISLQKLVLYTPTSKSNRKHFFQKQRMFCGPTWSSVL